MRTCWLKCTHERDCELYRTGMPLSVREVRDEEPGGNDASARLVREWVCPECDYFEEAEPREG
jgi:hypothetical protein